MTSPAMPGENLPPTRLDEARAELFAALRRVWVALGWPAERASLLPPQRAVPPQAWVDVPVLHQSPTVEARGMSATFPVVLVTDGAEEQQVKLQDRLMAHAWDQLAAVKVAGHRVIVQTGGPDDVEVSAGVLRGLIFRVQVPLQVQTLCPQPLARDNNDGGTPP